TSSQKRNHRLYPPRKRARQDQSLSEANPPQTRLPAGSARRSNQARSTTSRSSLRRMGRLKHVTAKNRTRRITCAPANAGLTSILCWFDLSLHVVHHRYGGDQNDGGNDLVRVKAGVKEAPRDANGGQCLHH